MLLSTFRLAPLLGVILTGFQTQAGVVSKRQHYANLSSPVPGQVLFPGRPFRVRYLNPATSATATQVSLFNNTGLFVIANYLPVTHHRTDTHVILPPWVSHGTYDFVFRDNNLKGEQEFQDVVVMPIYVGKRPPFGIGGNEKDVEDVVLIQSDDDDDRKILDKREPHLPRFISPSNRSNFLIGSRIPISYTDGETSANQVEFILISSLTGIRYKLGITVPFENFRSNSTYRISDWFPEGVYKLVARENSDRDKLTFIDSFSIDIRISKPLLSLSSSVKIKEKTTEEEEDDESEENLPDSEEIEKEEVEEVEEPVRRFKRHTIEMMSEGPSVILPSVSQDVSLGSPIECKIHDPSATTETVKFILQEQQQSKYSKQRLLGQVSFKGHFAGGQFMVPSDISIGTYNLIVKQNSISRPDEFINVGFTSIFITNKEGYSTLDVINEAFKKYDQQQSSKNKYDERVEISQVRVSPDSPFIFGELDFNRPSTSSNIDHGNFNNDKVFLKSRKNQRNNRRENHLPRIISPFYEQIIPAGTQFKCVMLDGQVTDEKVKFVLRHQQHLENDEYTLGEISFDSSLADHTCTIPSNVIPGVYQLVAKENTISDPDSYNDILSVNIIVTNPKGNKKSKKRRSFVQLKNRAPHPVTLISPILSQDIIPGESVECYLKDGETTATLVRFLLRKQDDDDDDDGNGDEIVLGQTSFSNFQARSTFQCPNNIKKGTYLFVVQENSSFDPEDFNDSVFVKVNVVLSPTTNKTSSTTTSTTTTSTPFNSTSSVPINSTSSVPINSTSSVPINSTSSVPSNNSTSPIVNPALPSPTSPAIPVASNVSFHAGPGVTTPASNSSASGQSGTTGSIFTPSSAAILESRWVSFFAILPLASLLLL